MIWLLGIKPVTVTAILKKLIEKSLVEHEKYGKVFPTAEGNRSAIDVLRKRGAIMRRLRTD